MMYSHINLVIRKGLQMSLATVFLISAFGCFMISIILSSSHHLNVLNLGVNVVKGLGSRVEGSADYWF